MSLLPPTDFIIGEVAERGKELWYLITNDGKQKSINAKQLLTLIETSEIISKRKKFRLCLVWFVHAILCAKDTRTSIPKKFVHLASRPHTYFANYPWGRESFDLTIKYLIKPLDKDRESLNLYGFPWAFMAWAYEATPSLRHGDSPEQPTEPRMLRWIADRQERECDQLFRNSENPHVDVVLGLIRLRNKEFTSHYDEKDVVLDMNFCSVLAGSYRDLEKEAEKDMIALDVYLKVTPTAEGLVDYTLGKTPYPGGRHWDGVKRIFTVMNLIKKHYVTLVFMVEEGRIDVYDCNIGMFDEDTFATYMFPIMVIFPRLLRDCGKFKHLPDDILKKDMWPYERLKGLPHNETGTTCGGYSLMFIEHLLTNTPMTELSDNTMEDCRYKWGVDVFHEKMSP